MVVAALVIAALAVGPEVVPPPPVPADYVLHWDAPEGCPSAAAIRTRVEMLAGPRPASGESAEVFGQVSQATAGLTLELRTRFGGREHARTMTATRCDALAEGMALVLAAALQHGLEAAMTEPRPTPPPRLDPPRPSVETPTPAPAPAPIPSTSPERAPPPPRSRRRAPMPVVGVAAVVEDGVLGVVTGGVAAPVALEWPRARLELGGLYLAPRRRIGVDRRGARLQAGAIQMRGCWVPRARRLALPLCAGVEIGIVRADSLGIGVQHRLLAPWAGPSLGVGLARELGPVRVWGGLDAVVRVVGADYALDGRVRFRQLPVSVRALVGLAVPLASRRRR